MTLEFAGYQEVPGGQPVQLWTLNEPGHPLNGSTRTTLGLISEGILRIDAVPFAKLEAK